MPKPIETGIRSGQLYGNGCECSWEGVVRMEGPKEGI